MQYPNRGIPHALRTARPFAVDLRQRRHWFDNQGEDGDIDPEPTPETETQPEKSGQQGSGDTTFTQADIDRIAGERAKRAGESAVNKLLTDLGVEKADDLKALIDAHRAREEEEKSDLEKAQAKIEEAERRAQEATERAQALEQARLDDRRDNAVRTALNGAEKPNAVLTLIKTDFADDLAAVMDDEGTVDGKAVEALAKKAEKEWPGMFKSGSPGSQSHAGGRPPTEDVEKLLDKLVPKRKL